MKKMLESKGIIEMNNQELVNLLEAAQKDLVGTTAQVDFAVKISTFVVNVLKVQELRGIEILPSHFEEDMS